MSDEITTDEIISGLEKGEKVYRGFKRGLEVAQAFKTLEGRSIELEKWIASLENIKSNLFVQIDELKAQKENIEKKSKDILNEAEEKSAFIINEATKKSNDLYQKSNEDLEQSAISLSNLKDEISNLEVFRDNLKAELKFLEEEKEKTRQRILDGVA